MRTFEPQVPDDLWPALYLRTVDLLQGPASPREQRLEDAFARLVSHNAHAGEQLRAILVCMIEAGVTCLPLKGAGRLCHAADFLLPRPLSDLDLLIHGGDAAGADRALRSLGYCAETWNSAEDTRLHLLHGPGLRYLRDGYLPVDLQLWLPGVPREAWILEEVWAAARRQGLASATVCHSQTLLMNPMHELLVAAAHFAVHRTPPLRLSPKWLTDMLILVCENAAGVMPDLLPAVQGGTFEEKLAKVGLADLVWPFRALPDAGGGERLWTWQTFWDTAERWGIREQARTACATMNAHWNTRIPGVPNEAEAVTLAELIHEPSARRLENTASVPAAYFERVRLVRSLPTARERLSYLWHLVFPEPSSLRTRYGLSDTAFLPWHYARHVVLTSRKLLVGLAARCRLHFSRRPSTSGGR